MPSATDAVLTSPPKNRLLSLEFMFYYAYIAFIYIITTPGLVALGNEYAHKLSQGLKYGWIPGRLMDASDHQWHVFRENIPLLAVIMALFVGVSLVARTVGGPRVRLVAMAAFSLAMIGYVHRAEAVYALAIVTVNFLIARIFGGSRLNPVLTWVFAAGYMIMAEYYGFKLSYLHPSLGWLDGYQPVYRWSQCVKLAMLRMVSHNTDYYWTLRQRVSPMKFEKHNESCSVCASGSACYDRRTEMNLALPQYNFIAYFSYIFYIPLYLTGPTMTYNAFVSQVHSPQVAYTKKEIVFYGVRLLACILLLEIMMHYFYVTAFTKHKQFVMSSSSVMTIGIAAYWMLMFLWLKFLILWRFARFFALADGIESPENMARCMNNNYTMSGFWRGWHRSFNRWLIRYMYVPLGGSRWKFYNIWVVFTFVALWHDMTMQLLAWSWLICIFLLIEFGGVFLSKALRLRELRIYRHIAALGAAFNILLMMIANLVGFSVGVDGAKSLLGRIFDWNGGVFVVGMVLTFFSAAHIMFELEKRRTKSD